MRYIVNRTHEAFRSLFVVVICDCSAQELIGGLDAERRKVIERKSVKELNWRKASPTGDGLPFTILERALN